MHPIQVQIVQQSWQQLAAIKPQVGAIFYDNLFRLDPVLRTLFRGDLVLQGQRLVAMIDVAVSGLGTPEQLTEALRQLGQRHHGYGVQPHDYATVASALLETLATGLGPSFTPEVKQAWVAVYTFLSDTMQQAV